MRANEAARREIRRQRDAVRAMLPRFRAAARARVARLRDTPAYRGMREAAARRRRRTLGALTVFLLLLLLIDCAGPSGRGTALAKATPSPAPPKTPVAAKPAPRPPLQAKLDSQKRPGYTLDARPGPDWLDDFRLQVAARSPRLARCFNGSERAGALRWTVSVDPKTGAVADHEFATLFSGDLATKQRECATQVLSDPTYLVRDPPQEALPNRVSLVLEF